MKEIVLASESPRRRALLEQLGLKFQVVPSNVNESFGDAEEPGMLVQRLARNKALEVGRKLGSKAERIVIGADTVVVINGRILGKPQNEAEAVSMLAMLSGKTHKVYTGVSLFETKSKRGVTAHEETAVKMVEMSMEEIEAYVKTGEPLDKAGAYAIQGLGSILVESINGCYYNVVGLPIPLLAKMLKQFGVRIF